MSTALARFQDDFARALLAPDAGQTGDFSLPGSVTRITRQPGFAVYRNTVLKGCIDALQANYPSILRLVGEEWFRAVAVIYARAHPPRDSRMLRFGEDFSDFLGQFPGAAELPYLSGVARLDWFWTEAHAAADATPLAPASITGLSPAQLSAKVLHPHPAARWAWFADQPVYTLWRQNREASDNEDPLEWRGEGVLVTRPRDAVTWTALDAGGCSFLEACAAGQTLANATAAALKAQENTDFAQLMATLLEAGAFYDPSRNTNQNTNPSTPEVLP